MEINILPSNHFRLVEHNWTGSYLLRQYGAAYRKSLRIISKVKIVSSSDWVGNTVWGSPIVALAPPQHP
jgi:hypothetical protein